jgi:hypothetical protein
MNISNFFGSTIRETFHALMGADLGPQSDEKKLTGTEATIRIVLTFFLLATAIALIIIDKANFKELPGIIIGGVLGYWLK